jgi:hypothetical protein
MTNDTKPPGDLEQRRTEGGEMSGRRADGKGMLATDSPSLRKMFAYLKNIDTINHCDISG